MGELGSVFVVRNVANMVVSTDMNLMAALQYAVNILKVPLHYRLWSYDCGGMREYGEEGCVLRSSGATFGIFVSLSWLKSVLLSLPVYLYCMSVQQ
jgi:hypothetical protein